MSKGKDLLDTKDTHVYLVTSIVRAGSFKEAVSQAPYGKIINIGLSDEETLESYE